MADSATANDGLKERLKPFYQRASEAEDRLSKLETLISTKNGISEPCNEESEKVNELESKLKEVTGQLAAEREKVAKFTLEGNKKDYRIIHLVRSLREAHLKLEKLVIN